MSDKPKCEVCGEPMPDGEEMFKYHGYSGPCPAPPLPKGDTPRTDAVCVDSHQQSLTAEELKLKDDPSHGGWAEYVPAHFARQLERELSQQSAREKDLVEAAQKAILAWEGHIHPTQAMIDLRKSLAPYKEGKT